MNILPIELREQIHAMSRDGATSREIAVAVGVSVETVRNYSASFSVWRRKLGKIVDALDEKIIESLGLTSDCDRDIVYEATVGLFAHVFMTCPMHPEAHVIDAVDEGVCRLCVRDGLRRHHARRKAAGRPILPPRKRRRAKPPPDAPEVASLAAPPPTSAAIDLPAPEDAVLSIETDDESGLLRLVWKIVAV